MINLPAMRGEGKLKLIVTLCGIAAVFFIGYKFVPVKLANSQLEDCVIEEAKFAGDPRRTAEIIRDNVWGCAQNLELEQFFDKKDILVTKESSKVIIELAYQREVELPGYTYTWNFEIRQRRDLY